MRWSGSPVMGAGGCVWCRAGLIGSPRQYCVREGGSETVDSEIWIFDERLLVFECRSDVVQLGRRVRCGRLILAIYRVIRYRLQIQEKPMSCMRWRDAGWM